MITFDRVSVTYAGSERAVLRDVTVRIDEGELCLVVGTTGSGKSTFLGAINGLVPHFTGGTLSGTVTVDGRDTRTHPPRELADVVGYVGQDPVAGFVTDAVEEELAYSMEHLALDPPVMRKRVEEILDLLGLADLRDRPLRTLSGGQQQRVAIGAALTAHPRVLILDEPTSALDPTAAEEVIAAITRLVHDLGMTVVLAEHRLERVIQHADSMIRVAGDGTITSGPPASVLAARRRWPADRRARPLGGLGPVAAVDPGRPSPGARAAPAPCRGPRCRRIQTGRGRRALRGLGARPDRPRDQRRVRQRRGRPVRGPGPARRRHRRRHGTQRLRQVVAAVGAPGVRPQTRRDRGRGRRRPGRPGACRRPSARRPRPAGRA